MDEDGYIIVGVEGTAHTIGVAIIQGTSTKILADVRSVFSPTSGGIHPREAATHIIQNFLPNLDRAFEEADVRPAEIDAVAFSQGPGLGPCLRATATSARSLAIALDKPLVGVNHPLAHIEIGKQLCQVVDPLTLYVSGGNTQLAAYENHRYHILGETHDIAVGNLIDQTARAIGYDYALAGPHVEQEALQSSGDLLPLPYSVRGTTIHYSGLMTAAVTAHANGASGPDVCYSLQEYAFAMLAEATEKALIISKKDDLLLTGGVAANKRLQEMVSLVADENGVGFHVVPPRLAGDNGVMIAVAGMRYHQLGYKTALAESEVLPRWRLDEVWVPW